MSQNSFWSRNWKLVLNIITLGALVILIFALRDQIASTFSNLTRVNAWALLLMIPIEFLNYHAQTRLYQRLFASLGNHLSYKHLFKLSLELNFVNHVFPSGGVTGISYFSVRIRDGERLTGGKATMVHVMKIALTLLSFELLIVFGMISLAVMGRVNGLVILVGGSLATLLLIGTAGFFYIAGSKQRINTFAVTATRGLNRTIAVVRRQHPETLKIAQVTKIFDDFHDSYAQLRTSPRELRIPFLYALLMNITEVMALYVVYIAFGHLVNIGAIILAYALANFAGLISVLPGGVGVYEAIMTAVLASTGVPAAVSLPVTVMYRVLNTAIQLPPGYYLYHKNLTRNRTADLEQGR